MVPLDFVGGPFCPWKQIRPLPVDNPLTRVNAGYGMCKQCDEIDAKIAQLEGLILRVLDQHTLDGINEMIAELEARKAALHPE